MPTEIEMQSTYSENDMNSIERIKATLKTLFNENQDDEDYVPNYKSYKNIIETIESSDDTIDDNENAIVDRRILKLIENLIRQTIREEEIKANKKLHLKSNDLLKAIKDVIHLSQNEPYGLRGCRLRIFVKRSNGGNSNAGENGKTKALEMGTLQFCDDTISTFELHLSFTERKWSFVDALPQFFRFINMPLLEHIFINSGFTLIRHKLYGLKPRLEAIG